MKAYEKTKCFFQIVNDLKLNETSMLGIVKNAQQVIIRINCCVNQLYYYTKVSRKIT
jgi:hypothetical protein